VLLSKVNDTRVSGTSVNRLFRRGEYDLGHLAHHPFSNHCRNRLSHLSGGDGCSPSAASPGDYKRSIFFWTAAQPK